jgi:hypothetical protein
MNEGNDVQRHKHMKTRRWRHADAAHPINDSTWRSAA